MAVSRLTFTRDESERHWDGELIKLDLGRGGKKVATR